MGKIKTETIYKDVVYDVALSRTLESVKIFYSKDNSQLIVVDDKDEVILHAEADCNQNTGFLVDLPTQ